MNSFRLFRRAGLCALLLIAVAGCMSTSETPTPSPQPESRNLSERVKLADTSTASHSKTFSATYGGDPESPESAKPITHLTNVGYVVDYSESHKDPVWSAYYNPGTELFTLSRPKNQPFTTDDRTVSKVTTKDFSQSDYQTNPHGYDRGHMAPSYAIGRGYGKDAQVGTFTCSNICPQEKGLNQQTWAAFEHVVSADYAAQFNGVWAIAGPIFSKTNPKRLNGEAEIPEAFFYVVVREDNGVPHALAVVMEQSVTGKKRPLAPFVKTVKYVEEKTGLKFFPKLSKSERERLENEAPDAPWHIEQDLVAPSFGGGN